jgi:pimeloyl-ACP methyl ester carboxylesterase/DNA-binding CsgD family transcriptional regulator
MWNTWRVEAPVIRFAPTSSGDVAWQEWGAAEAPPLLVLPPLAQNIEMMWEKPAFWRPIRRMASRVRYLHFDKLGTGLSDPVAEPHGLEARVEQVIAVLDAAEIERAALMGFSEGGMVAVAAAVWHPERVDAVVLADTWAGASDLPGVAAHGALPSADEVFAFWKRFVAAWGTEHTLTLTHLGPSLQRDPGMRRWMPRYERGSASPAMIGRWIESAFSLDVVDLLPDVAVPTLVMHLSDDQILPVAHGRYVAASIPSARYQEFDGRDHFIWVSPDVDDYIDTVHGFLSDLGLASGSAPTTRIRDSWDPFASLTPGERRCVRLAQRGLSNAAIADVLGLSVRTVENHMSRAYSKLGVSSRVELALADDDVAGPAGD